MSKTNNRAHPPGSGRHMGTKEKLELREQARAAIRVLLAEQPLSPGDIAERLGLNQSTAYAHLKHMAKELREVRRTGRCDARRRELWELGEDVALPTGDELLDRGIAPKRPMAPAVQIGMWRDGLVAALFGAPEQGAAA
jgi:DNA-binding CsgD family transcriptional regulator